MTTAMGMTLVVGLLGQVLAAPPFSEDPAVRMAYMKGSVAPYAIRPADPGSNPLRLRPDPVFRLDNPVGGVKDGVVYLWADAETGRPEVSLQVFRTRTGYWMHEWTSLATGPLVAEAGGDARWHPSKPGVAFRPVPDAPAPAATPEARLRQMRAMAEGFSARDFSQNKEWNDLRLLPRPWHRYGKAGSGVEDGALFALVLGTDPEVFLLIEARPGPGGGPRWHYALAPMSSFELKVAHKGAEVWALPWRPRAKDPADTFYDMQYSVEQP